MSFRIILFLVMAVQQQAWKTLTNITVGLLDIRYWASRFNMSVRVHLVFS